MNTGITFTLDDGTSYHTYTDLNLRMLAEVIKSPAVPKRHLITDVLGIDGYLEVQNGPIRFENRNITARFEGQDQNFDEWCEACSNVENALHGRHVQAVFDIDPDYYWEGFVTVTPTKEAIAYSEMEICIDAYPYKIYKNGFLKTVTIGASGTTVTIAGSRMPYAPVINASNGNMTVTVDGAAHKLISGDNQMDFELYEGDNTLTFSGSGTIKISWKKGML